MDKKEVLYSKNQINKAAKIYCSETKSQEEEAEARKKINNWRAAHAFPLQIIYCHIKKTVGNKGIVAQRLKRLTSIEKKLKRFPAMALCTMQDIGGCRVIVDDIDGVYNLVEKLKTSRMRHKLKEEYDYIERPKADGYRSYHLSYAYFSDRNTKYNGLCIEIQIRTHIQHLWATAVETMDAFTGEALKNGSGSEINREFFKIASKLLEVYEKSDKDIEVVKRSEFAKEMKKFDSENHVISRLETIRESIIKADKDAFANEGYYLLKLNSKTHNLDIEYFMPVQASKATDEYDKYEKERGIYEDIVLVSTLSYDDLQKAYPNYFTDIAEFNDLMKKFVID